jgi:hypothetical protein
MEQKKLYSPALTQPPLSHLTSCTPTKSNLYLANSQATAVIAPALYRLLTFHVPTKMPLFREILVLSPEEASQLMNIT